MCVKQQFIVEQPYTLDSSLMVFENAVARLTHAQDFMQNEIIDLGIPDEAQEYIEAEIRLIAAHTEFEAALIILNYLHDNTLAE